MKLVKAFMMLSLLAACGAEAPPRAPTEPGITMGGEVRIGVRGRL